MVTVSRVKKSSRQAPTAAMMSPLGARRRRASRVACSEPTTVPPPGPSASTRPPCPLRTLSDGPRAIPRAAWRREGAFVARGRAREGAQRGLLDSAPRARNACVVRVRRRARGSGAARVRVDRGRAGASGAEQRKDVHRSKEPKREIVLIVHRLWDWDCHRTSRALDSRPCSR